LQQVEVVIFRNRFKGKLLNLTIEAPVQITDWTALLSITNIFKRIY